MLRLRIPLCALLVLAACARPYGEASEPDESTTSGDPKTPPAKHTMSADGDALPLPVPAPVAAPSDPPSADPAPAAAPTDTVWTGKLAKVAAPFGGSPYCKYTITFDEIEVTMTLGPDEKVKAAEVKARATETTTTDCPNATIPRHEHTYLYRPSADDAPGAPIDLVGLATNSPRAEAVLTLGRRGDAAREVTLTVHRVDQVAPLDWTLERTGTLAPP